MKIAVNTRLLLRNKLEGIGWFTYESFKRIVQQHPEHEFFFIFDRSYSKEYVFAENVTPIVVGPPARHPILIYLWYEYSIPRVLKKIDADVFISPDAFTSLSVKIPNLVVLHDLNFEHYPENLPLKFRWYYRHFTPKFAAEATRIATVSHFSKHDIVYNYNVPSDKIDVVYNGSGALYKPVGDVEKQKVREEITAGDDYFLFVGALNPRKNLANIFKAFDIYKANSNSFTKFVVVGERMYWSKDVRQAYENMQCKGDVVFTGRLNQNKLSGVLGSAKALVFASMFEGFGIPIVEAFNAHIPVITSNVSAMPEIANNAALLVDPLSINDIASAMTAVDEDENLCNELVAKGEIRKKDFSWDNTAEELWTSILNTLKSKTD